DLSRLRKEKLDGVALPQAAACLSFCSRTGLLLQVVADRRTLHRRVACCPTWGERPLEVLRAGGAEGLDLILCDRSRGRRENLRCRSLRAEAVVNKAVKAACRPCSQVFVQRGDLRARRRIDLTHQDRLAVHPRRPPRPGCGT